MVFHAVKAPLAGGGDTPRGVLGRSPRRSCELPRNDLAAGSQKKRMLEGSLSVMCCHTDFDGMLEVRRPVVYCHIGCNGIPGRSQLAAHSGIVDTVRIVDSWFGLDKKGRMACGFPRLDGHC